MNIDPKDCVFHDNFQELIIECNPIEGPYIYAQFKYQDGFDFYGDRELSRFELWKNYAYDDDGNDVEITKNMVDQLFELAKENAGTWR